MTEEERKKEKGKAIKSLGERDGRLLIKLY
jgi:hypothetical protein